MKKYIIGILSALVLIYGGGAYYFSQHTFPNTRLNGENHSYERLTSLQEPRPVNEPLRIAGRGDRQQEIAPGDIDLQKQPIPNESIQQNPLMWPAAFFTTRSYEVDTEYVYDAEKLSHMLADSSFMKDTTESTDATILLEETGYKIQPGEIGTKIDENTLQQEVTRQLDEGNLTVTLPDSAYTPARVQEDDPSLQKELEFLNGVYNTKIVYDFADREYTYTGETLVDLYDKQPDGTYEISYERTRALMAQMATETDTFGEDREFTTTHGTTVTIPGGPSVYGWLMDVDSTTEEFIAWVEEQHSEVTTPFYFRKAMNRETDEIGDTYIEIDLSSQWMYIYLDGELIDEGPTVSGQPSFGTPTPVAVNYIIDKMKDRVLRGTEPVSGEEYETPVDYWFSINWSDIGIHNSTWRTEFGGDIYQWLGSYGCINVIDHLAETIYYHIPVGTPVISYGG